MAAHDPIQDFHSYWYLRHNQRRLEHLVSLECAGGLDLRNKAVLELGAGVGDHTHFFLDRGCRVLTTDGRPENFEVLRRVYSGNARVVVEQLDMDDPPAPPEFLKGRTIDVVYCYGLLYHLAGPEQAIAFMSGCCGAWRDGRPGDSGLLLLETCVSLGRQPEMNPVQEPHLSPTQAVSGTGCRPTRVWVFEQLRRHFAHVYLPITQPLHEEFPIDWTVAPPPGRLIRAVFVASRRPIADPLLLGEIVMRQKAQ